MGHLDRAGFRADCRVFEKKTGVPRLVVRRPVRNKFSSVPLYRYYCPTNDVTIDVQHGMRDVITRWDELCAAADCPLGETEGSAAVERHLFPPAIHTPMSNSRLKSQGFTKLVRRDKGVYENVTALEGEKRYVKADDPGSMPDFRGRGFD